MTAADPKLAGGAPDLKAAFDRSFTVPAADVGAEHLDFIVFRCRKSLFALSLADLSSLERARKIIAVPGQGPLCQGMTALRGVLVPVFSLPKILFDGSARDGRGFDSGWLAICRRKDLLALEFGGFEGHLRIAKDEVHPPMTSSKTNYARGTFRADGKSGVIVDVAKISEMLTRSGNASTMEEKWDEAGHSTKK